MKFITKHYLIDRTTSTSSTCLLFWTIYLHEYYNKPAILLKRNTIFHLNRLASFIKSDVLYVSWKIKQSYKMIVTYSAYT